MPKQYLQLTDDYGNPVVVSRDDIVTVKRCKTGVTQLSMTNGTFVYVVQSPIDVWDLVEPGETESAVLVTERTIAKRRKATNECENA